MEVEQRLAGDNHTGLDPPEPIRLTGPGTFGTPWRSRSGHLQYLLNEEEQSCERTQTRG